MTSKEKIIQEFQTIPGVGKRISLDFWKLGFRSCSDVGKMHPQKSYERLCTLQEKPVDRCMLYVLRCAQYSCSRTKHKKELLNWWAWKDKK